MKIEYKERFYLLTCLLVVALVIIFYTPISVTDENGNTVQLKKHFVTIRLCMAFIGGYIFYVINVFWKEVTDRKDAAMLIASQFLLLIKQVRVITNLVRIRVNSGKPQVSIDPSNKINKDLYLNKQELIQWFETNNTEKEKNYINRIIDIINTLRQARYLMPKSIRTNYDQIRNSNILKLNTERGFDLFRSENGFNDEFEVFIDSVEEIESFIQKRYQKLIK